MEWGKGWQDKEGPDMPHLRLPSPCLGEWFHRTPPIRLLRLSIPKEHLGSWKTPKTFVFTIPEQGTASLYLKSKIMK